MATTLADGARLRVRGRLDSAAGDRFNALLEDLVEPQAVVRVDLSRAEVLPVAVLRALAASHRRLGEAGGLVVEDPSEAAVRSLRTSGLHRVLCVERRAAAPRTAPRRQRAAEA
jgi:anti-anti-sigma regulatory factor